MTFCEAVTKPWMYLWIAIFFTLIGPDATLGAVHQVGAKEYAMAGGSNGVTPLLAAVGQCPRRLPVAGLDSE
jgi:hypothetical protein